MKILVVSLLRLGDFIMTLPAISRLKVKYPDSEIHVLLNKQFEGVVGLIEGVDKFYYFDRLQYQKDMSNFDSHILNPYFRLSHLSQQLNLENFDHIYNFTHNKLSGFLIDSIHADKKFGLIFKNDKFQIENHDWLSYLNSTNQDSSSEFHFCDILTEGQGLAFLDGPVRLKKIEGQNILEENNLRKPIIAFQIFTSDSKKI